MVDQNRIKLATEEGKNSNKLVSFLLDRSMSMRICAIILNALIRTMLLGEPEYHWSYAKMKQSSEEGIKANRTLDILMLATHCRH